ncbi:hypothetical protein D3C77_575090 [compost metagenome]
MYTGHTAQHIAHVQRTLLDHRLATDHRTRTGVVLNHGFLSVSQPVTDDLDVGRCQFEAAGRQGPGALHRLEHHGALGDLVGQAATLQQRLQGLFRRQGAGHCRGLLAGHQLRTEEQLQRGLLSQLAQGRCQRLRRDLDSGCSLVGIAAGNTTTDSQRQRQWQ